MVKLNILLAGVGGQGIITMGRIIAEAAINEGVKAMVAETHGLSQRNGAVNVHVRLGDIMAPLIERGGADYLVALEATEALRNLYYANPARTIIILNNYTLRPALSKAKEMSIEEILQRLSRFKVFVVDANDIAIKSGNPKASNAALVGFMWKLGAFKGLIEHEESFYNSLKLESNITAFKMAMEVEESIKRV